MFDLFHLVTWDDLDLYYGHKAREMILTDVSDTIHADSLALFALNIEILLADVPKPEKSKILTLTWPVTSSVTSGSNVWPCTGSSRTGLSNGVWNLEIGPVVWEISGGGPLGPPPAGRVTNQTPAGRGLMLEYADVEIHSTFCFQSEGLTSCKYNATNILTYRPRRNAPKIGETNPIWRKHHSKAAWHYQKIQAWEMQLDWCCSMRCFRRFHRMNKDTVHLSSRRERK